MNVFISVDMEGISGLVRWADVSPAGIDFAVNRRRMTDDTNAAIDGAFAAGATHVIVEENHGVEDLCVLEMDTIDPRCAVIRGAGRPGATTMAGLDSSTDVVLLVGHHARAGSFPGIMAHTISYGGFRRVLLHGEPIGEPDFFAIRAGELGVPIGMVSGDQVVAEQVRRICPDAEAVIVKEALANQSGLCIPPARARTMIRDGAATAIRNARAGLLTPYRDTVAPYEFDVQLRQPAPDAMRNNLARLEGFELTAPDCVHVSASDMDLGFRRVAYLGYADREGVTRH